jgi:hypothetical protein
VRTTLSIDDDIARLVEDEVRRSGDSFKGTVNRLLRDGLTAKAQNAPPKPFVVAPLFMGRAGRNYDNILPLLEEFEGPGQR